MKMILRNLVSFHSFKNLFYPPFCLFCDERYIIETLDGSSEISSYLCEDCLEESQSPFVNFCKKCFLPVGEHHNTNECKTCKGRKIYYDGAAFVNDFDSCIGQKTMQFKYQKDFLLSKPLVCLMAEISKKLPKPDMICSVPMHWLKFWQRGFNQADVLARGVCKKYKLNEFDGEYNSLLKRNKKGLAQVGKTKSARSQNIKGLYKVKNANIIKGKVIWLVDDVITTGSTMSECSKLLKEAGAARVYALSVVGVAKKK